MREQAEQAQKVKGKTKTRSSESKLFGAGVCLMMTSLVSTRRVHHEWQGTLCDTEEVRCLVQIRGGGHIPEQLSKTFKRETEGVWVQHSTAFGLGPRQTCPV